VSGTTPGSGAAAPDPESVTFADAVVVTKAEAFELCDLLERSERALSARGWSALARRAGWWVGLFEDRLSRPAAQCPPVAGLGWAHGTAGAQTAGACGAQALAPTGEQPQPVFQAAGRQPHRGRQSVEDRVSSAAALELEEAVGAGDQPHPVP